MAVKVAINGFGRIGRRNGTRCLKNNFPIVVNLIHQMNGDATFYFLIFNVVNWIIENCLYVILVV